MPPKKKQEPEAVAEPEFTPETPLEIPDTEVHEVPQQAEPVQDAGPKYQVERTAEQGAIATEVLPKVLAGVCEFCGPGQYDQRTSPMGLVEDWTVEPTTQIGRCQHYKGVKIRCSYCPLSASWAGNISSRNHNIFVSPWNPKQLIIVCSDMGCQDKHYRRALGGRF